MLSNIIYIERERKREKEMICDSSVGIYLKVGCAVFIFGDIYL